MIADISPVFDQLQSLQWFSNVGNPPTREMRLQIEPVRSWSAASNLRGSVKASNAFLEASNMLTRELSDAFRVHYRKWNEVADEVRTLLNDRILPGIDRSAELVIDETSLPVVANSVRWDLIHVLMEYAYSAFVPPRFFEQVFQVYKSGNFPCDWDEKWPDGKLWVF
jgi:hypothetical protein